jgi:hypothetical protein
MKWFKLKKSADECIQEFVGELSRALDKKLASVVLFGSKASGEYREGRSDINVFVVLEDVCWGTLQAMAPAVRRWLKAGNPMPVIVQRDEVRQSARGLPIEFLDMQDHHRVLIGTDPLRDLVIDRVHLRAQCEHELVVKQLKLRQAVTMAAGNSKRLREVLLRSLPSILSLFRAVLRLEGEVPRASKLVAAKELAKRAGFDADCLERVWDLHMRRSSDNLEDLARQYLDCIERVVSHLGRRIESR